MMIASGIVLSFRKVSRAWIIVAISCMDPISTKSASNEIYLAIKPPMAMAIPDTMNDCPFAMPHI